MPAFALGHDPLCQVAHVTRSQLDALLRVLERIAQIKNVDVGIGAVGEVVVCSVAEIRVRGLGGDFS